MKLFLRNGLATLASLTVLMVTFHRLEQRYPVPVCIIHFGSLPWRDLARPLIPLISASLFAGIVFALLSRESVSRSAGWVGGLLLMTSAFPTPMLSSRPRAWFCNLAWLLALIAVAFGVLAYRKAQAWVLKWHRAT